MLHREIESISSRTRMILSSFQIFLGHPLTTILLQSEIDIFHGSSPI
uniref:Uncharacterized protein n=1 Tax=Lepeophtheirus salmonis TaxID=72036 RepID=A0A0K2V809_LEPSM